MMDEAPVSGCYLTVDGTDFPIEELTCFDPGWYCHKFNSAGLRYEVAVTVRSKKIAWINGPFPCGSMPDLLIFRSKLKSLLLQTESVLCDSGYCDSKCIKPSERYDFISSVHNSLRARREAMNGRLKAFKVLSERFRHDLSPHSTCFFAVTNVVQLRLTQHPLFEIPALL